MTRKPIQMPPLPPPRLDIINLIDILLTLLAFFMLTSVFAENRIRRQAEIALPRMQQGEKLTVKPGRLVLELDRGNVLYCAGRELDRSALPGLLARESPASSVIIRADRRCRYEWVVEVLDLVKQSGLRRIGLEVLGK